MREIAAAVQEGAAAYLNRQYRTIAIVGVVICALLFWRLGGYVAIGFVIGAILSGLAGYVGMNIPVPRNLRTSEAALNRTAPELSQGVRGCAISGIPGFRHRLPRGHRDFVVAKK